MKTKILMCMLLLLSGCQSLQKDERTQYMLTAEAYKATVDTLTEAIGKGKFNAEEMVAIAAASHEARLLLDQWNLALRTGQQFKPDLAASLMKVLDTLQQFQKKGEK